MTTRVEKQISKNSASHQTPTTLFTLVELLVVIGIIGLLAALAFPVLNKVRGNAKKHPA
jgi:prepilin-type N-terminal cleavage/methylation domain-containing protein